MFPGSNYGTFEIFNTLFTFISRTAILTMDERTLDRIFSGAFHDLPPVLSKIVRIFTSSTFTGNDQNLNLNYFKFCCRHVARKEYVDGKCVPEDQRVL